VISKSVRKIMRFVESCADFTANDVNRELFKEKLDKNEKGSMYRLFQAMVREGYLQELGKREGLKVYSCAAAGQRKPDSEPPCVTSPGGTAVLPQPSPVEPSPRERLMGKLREFVHLKQGIWNHDDWLWLVHRDDIVEFGFSHEEIGSLLETEKTAFWVNRSR
jgi:hypothetical protein